MDTIGGQVSGLREHTASPHWGPHPPSPHCPGSLPRSRPPSAFCLFNERSLLTPTRCLASCVSLQKLLGKYKPGARPVSGLQDSPPDALNFTGQPSREVAPTLKQIPVGPWSPQAKPSLNTELTRLTLSCNYTGSRAPRAQAGMHACSLSA